MQQRVCESFNHSTTHVILSGVERERNGVEGSDRKSINQDYFIPGF